MYTTSLLWGTSSGSVLRDGRDIKCAAGPQKHPKQAAWWIVCPGGSLLFFLKQRGLQTLLETSYSMQGRPPHPLLQFFSRRRWGRKLTFSGNPSALHPASGAGVCCPPTSQRLRLRPWGTRVPPALKLRLQPGRDPRWSTGHPAPDTSLQSWSPFPPRSWTTQTNWPTRAEQMDAVSRAAFKKKNYNNNKKTRP